MIYLVGVEHKVQWRKPGAPAKPSRLDNWALYSSTIREAILQLKPPVVAEELNKDFLREKNNAESILVCLKNCLEIELKTTMRHVFVEPTASEKRARGYREDDCIEKLLGFVDQKPPAIDLVWAHMVAHQFPIRERFWIEKMKDNFDSDILFVCGDVHVDTFPRLLKREGIPYQVVKRGIGVGQQMGEYKGLQYAQENNFFEMANCFCTDRSLITKQCG